jgi:hypothetical protein
MQWVQGLQHLASQQQEVRAAKSKEKAARKKDKVWHMHRHLLMPGAHYCHSAKLR